MKQFLRGALVLAMAAAMTAPTLAQDITGLWRRPDNTTDFELTMCGQDNARLCGRVVALRDGMDTEENRPYLGDTIIKQAKQVGKNRWKGPMNVFGQSGDATITQASANVIMVKVCAYVVICREYDMARVQ